MGIKWTIKSLLLLFLLPTCATPPAHPPASNPDAASHVVAIRAATVDAARLLGLEDRTGDISTGKLADIIAVKGDPSRDIKSLQQVQFVMKGGEVVKDMLTSAGFR